MTTRPTRNLSGIVLLSLSAAWAAAKEPPPAAEARTRRPGFTVITRESGVEQIVQENYAAHPKWWLSGLHLVDLDGDGNLDLFLSAHGTPGALAALNDGKGRFRVAPGKYPATEIHLAYDFDEDGRIDLVTQWGHYAVPEGRSRIFRNEGGEKFVDVTAAAGLPETGRSIKGAGDLNQDGSPDLISIENKRLVIHLNDGKLDIVGYTSANHPRQIAVYRNDLPAHNWIAVRPVGLPGNRGAAGAKIRLYAPGTKQLLWYEQVAIYDSQASASYFAFAQTERHFGLGKHAAADVSVEFYPSGKVVRQASAAANRTVVVRE